MTPDLPSLDDLGRDLLSTTRWQRWLALIRPFLGILGYAACWRFGVWWLSPVAVFLIFVAVVTVTHDVVHRTLGLRARATDLALFVSGAVLLESGHAYLATHRQHHRVFPSAEDPEGYPAHLGLVGAVCYGPVFLVRLWFWAFRRATGTERCWLMIEAGMVPAATTAALLLWPVTPAAAAYVLMAVVGSWVYPLLTVYLPHHDFGDDPIHQTRTLRGRLLPGLFLELTFHLEHHLYPQVPSHHLRELSERLDPVLRQAGARIVRVP